MISQPSPNLSLGGLHETRFTKRDYTGTGWAVDAFVLHDAKTGREWVVVTTPNGVAMTPIQQWELR